MLYYSMPHRVPAWGSPQVGMCSLGWVTSRSRDMLLSSKCYKHMSVSVSVHMCMCACACACACPSACVSPSVGLCACRCVCVCVCNYRRAREGVGVGVGVGLGVGVTRWPGKLGYDRFLIMIPEPWMLARRIWESLWIAKTIDASLSDKESEERERERERDIGLWNLDQNALLETTARRRSPTKVPRGPRRRRRGRPRGRAHAESHTTVLD